MLIRVECLEGQSALKCIVPQRENSTESLKVLKGLNSDKRGRGSRTSTTTRTRTVILTTRSARLRRQLKIKKNYKLNVLYLEEIQVYTLT